MSNFITVSFKILVGVWIVSNKDHYSTKKLQFIAIQLKNFRKICNSSKLELQIPRGVSKMIKIYYKM